MPRGNLWDGLTLGRARRRRRMRRQLRALDRWYAAQEGPPSSRRSHGDGVRRFLVGATTSVVAVVATVALLNQQGVAVGLHGVSRRTGAGPALGADGVGSYAFMGHQPGSSDVPVAYDPCRPIHVVVNDAQAPPGADQILAQALAKVHAATGLEFARDGSTDELPSRDRATADSPRYGPGWSPVLVAWTSPDQDPGLAGTVAGLGGSASVADPVTGHRRYVTGTVSLDGPAATRILLRPGGASEVEAIVMHELGHLVGLAHVDDRRELMYHDNAGRTSFGPGDLQGLARLGTGRCGN